VLLAAFKQQLPPRMSGDDRMPMSLSPTDYRPPLLSSPAGSHSPATSTPLVTPTHEDAQLLVGLFQRPSYPHKESFVRGM